MRREQTEQPFTAVARVAADHGVRTVFGVMGDGNLPFIDTMTRTHGARFVAAAREDGSILMADAYARVTGSVGVASVTHGPGLTNAATALVEAARSRVPLVLVAADTDPTSSGHPQDLDQISFVRACGAELVGVRSVAAAEAAAVAAFRLAAGDRRPVVLNVPVRGLPEGIPVTMTQPSLPEQRIAPDPRAVDDAAHLIRRSRRVVVLAGRGAVASGAAGALVQLADRAGALLATTLLAKGMFAGHAFDLGICGGFSSDLSRGELTAADCVVAVGASLNAFTTDGGELLKLASVVHCDVDPAAIGRHVPPRVAVIGDARTTAEKLTEALPVEGPARGRSAALAERLATFGFGDEFTDASDETGVDLRSLCLALDRLVSPDRLLVVDGGHAALSEPARMIAVRRPQDFVFPLGFGSIGLALGAAVGAAVAQPRRSVLAAVGDGGFMMSLQELDTAVRERLPLIVVVLNDAAYDYEFHNMVRLGIPTGLAEFERPDLAAVASAFGARGETVRNLTDLERLSAVLARPDGPVLVDAHITRRVKTTWFSRHEG